MCAWRALLNSDRSASNNVHVTEHCAADESSSPGIHAQPRRRAHAFATQRAPQRTLFKSSRSQGNHGRQNRRHRIRDCRLHGGWHRWPQGAAVRASTARGTRQVISVTRRGREIAQIVPSDGRTLLKRGLGEGWITRGEDRPPERMTRHRPVAGTPTTTELIRADRDVEHHGQSAPDARRSKASCHVARPLVEETARLTARVWLAGRDRRPHSPQDA